MSQSWKSILQSQGATYGAGASEAQIASFESEHKIKLPVSYREFLREVGWAEIETESGLLSVAGLGADVSEEINLTFITREARGAGVEERLLPIADEGEPLFLDVESPEGAIVCLTEVGAIELAGSFGEWLRAELEE